VFSLRERVLQDVGIGGAGTSQAQHRNEIGWSIVCPEDFVVRLHVSIGERNTASEGETLPRVPEHSL
jgi:hypothetical protein